MSQNKKSLDWAVCTEADIVQFVCDHIKTMQKKECLDLLEILRKVQEDLDITEDELKREAVGKIAIDLLDDLLTKTTREEQQTILKRFAEPEMNNIDQSGDILRFNGSLAIENIVLNAENGNRKQLEDVFSGIIDN